MAKRKKGAGYVVGQVFKWLGIALFVAAVAGVICYFAIPDFKVWVQNSWTDLKNQIGNNQGATKAVKMLIQK